jgi:pimeloyl-ACP methyl ester carboxylesterase
VNNLGHCVFPATVSGGQSIFFGNGSANPVDITPGFISSTRHFGTYLQINDSDVVVAQDHDTVKASYYIRTWNADSPGNDTIVDSDTLGGFVDTPTINNSGQVAYLRFDGTSTYTLYSTDTAELPPFYYTAVVYNSLFRPLLADNGSIVGRVGTAGVGISVYDSTLSTSYVLADTLGVSAFSALDALPGISEDGQIVAFYGTDANGPGIFLATAGLTGFSTSTVDRIVGTQADGFNAFAYFSRVAVKTLPPHHQLGYVAYVVTQNGVSGLYVSEFQSQGFAAPPLVSSPNVVVTIGQTLPGLTGTVSSVSILDPINTNGAVAFMVTDTTGAQSIILASLPSLVPRRVSLAQANVSASDLIDSPIIPVTDTKALSTATPLGMGVVADDVTPVLFQLTAPAGDYTIAVSPNGSSYAAGNGGTLPGLISVLQAGQWINTTTIASSSFDAGSTAYMYLGGLSWADFSGSPANGVTLTVNVYPTHSASVVASTTFLVRPQPVVLVHGIASDATTWSPDFINALVAKGEPADYVQAITYGAASILHNPGGVAWSQWAPSCTEGFEPLAIEVDNDLHKVETELRINWDVTRYDVVGHSQGGVLLRMLCQTWDSRGTSGVFTSDASPVVSSANLYRGRFRRVITIGSPHNGSLIAYYIDRMPQAIHLLTQLLGKSALIMAPALNKFDPMGPNIGDINQWPVDPRIRFHCIQTTIDLGAAPGSRGVGSDPLIYLVLGLDFPLVEYPNEGKTRGQVLLPHGSDGIVDFISQGGGSGTPTDYPATDVSHCAIDVFGVSLFGVLERDTQTASADVGSDVANLLIGPNKNFGTFFVPERISKDPLALGAYDQLVPLVYTINAILENLTPHIPSTNINYSLTVPSNLPLLGTVNWEALVYGTNGISTNWVDIQVNTNDSTQVTLSINSNVVGQVVLSAEYMDTNGDLVFATPIVAVSVPTSPGATLTNIALLPPTLSLGVQYSISTQIVGDNSDGSQSYLYTSPEQVTYVSSAPDIASVDTNGTITMNAFGTATIFASYAGFTAQMVVSSPSMQPPNVPPVLPVIANQVINDVTQLVVTNTATELNPNSTLSYLLLNAPAGASINTNGIITWIPSQAQGPSTNVITTVATGSDPYDSVNPSLSATNSFIVIVVVQPPNVVPVLPVIPNQVVNELTPFRVTNTATESDPNSTLSYLLLNPPPGASISANGIITWTLSQAQSPSTNLITTVATSNDPSDPANPTLSATNGFYVVVQEVNVAPVLPVIPNQVVYELTQLKVINTANESNIHSTVSYQLLNAPTGATISANGIITWTPSLAQYPSTNVITTVATGSDAYDLVNPSLSATNSFTVVVEQPNVAPVPPAIPNQTVKELTQLTVTNTYTAPNTNSTLSYLLLNPPAGATISANGIITWTPSQAQSPGNTLIKTAATSNDPYDLLHPKLSTTNSFFVTVQEVNVAPVLPVIANQTASALTRLTVLNAASESNIHDSLAYRLVNLPAGAAIDVNGIITWIPSLAQATGTNVITTVVTGSNPYDSLHPSLSATNSFSVVVNTSQNTYTWTNTLGGDWRVAANWSPNGVPGQADNAYIPNNGTGPTVMTSVGTSVGVLTLGGGSGSGPTLAGPAPLTVIGPLNWSEGTIQGVVQCNGGTLIGSCYLDGGQLINTGTLAWDYASLSDGGYSVISNAPGATINLTINGKATWYSGAFPGTATFYNAGQLNVLAGASGASIADTFINTGTVSVNSGTLNLQNGGTNDDNSTITVATNATLEFSGPASSPFTCNSGSELTDGGNLLFSGGIVNLGGTVSVAGTNTFSSDVLGLGIVHVTGYYPITTPLVISGGTVNLDGTGALTPPVVTMSGGTLSNSVPLVINGPLNWSGGTIEGVVQCNGGTWSGNNLTLYGGELINAGTLSWTNARITDGTGSVISNAPGATINLTINSTLNGQATTDSTFPPGPATFYNAGQLNVLAGANGASIADTFINTGTVSVNSGTLNLQSGGTNDNNSTITVAANATLKFGSEFSGPFTCNSGSELTGAGNLLFSGGIVNLGGTVSVSGTNTFTGNGISIVNVTGNYPITTPLVISGGTVNLDGTGALTPPVVTMSGGTLSNSVPLVINGPLNWSGGTIQGVVQFNGGTWSGQNCNLDGGELINAGTLTWTNAIITDGAGSVISNAPGATINLGANWNNPATSKSILWPGTATFCNAGQLNVLAVANGTSIADTFINTGTVSVNSGTLNLQSGGTNDNHSTITVAANATLEFSGSEFSGPFTCNSGSELTGAGNLLFSEGQVNLAGTVSVTGTSTISWATVNVSGSYSNTTLLVISGGGVLTNNAPLVINGPLNWNGRGTIQGVVQFNGGTLSGPSCWLDGGELINTGTLVCDRVQISDGAGSVISNAPGATINFTPNGVGGVGSVIAGLQFGGQGTFYNAGQLNVSAGTNDTFIDDTFINTGTVLVNSGTLDLLNGGTNLNEISVATNATLRFSNYPFSPGGTQPTCTYPTFSFNSGSVLNDTGNLVIGGGYTYSDGYFAGCGTYTVNLGGTGSVQGTNIFGLDGFTTTVNVTGNYAITSPLVISGGTVNLNGTGALTPPVVTMSGGTLSNSVHLVINGPLNWSGGKIQGVVECYGGTWKGNNCGLDGGELINAGTLTWTNANISDGAGSAIINAPGATINLTANGTVTTHSYAGTATLYNSGRLNVSAGSSPASIGDAFNNSGTVSVNSGTLSLSALYNQTAGLTLLNGGNINNALPLQIQGGTLGGNGSINGSVTNSGVLSPGTPLGKMTIGGNYVQTSAGTLNIGVGGTVPGTSFDLLAVTGKATLAGTLNVGLTNGYYPANTNAFFTFLNASPLTGAFANFSYPYTQVGLQLNYAANSASIQVTSLGPVSVPVALKMPEYCLVLSIEYTFCLEE